MQLDGKVALVTGGGSGIGRGIALGFAAAGAKVAVSGRRSELLDETVDQMADAGSEGLAIPGDVTQSGDAQRMVRETAERLGGLDILVNNAGMYRTGKTLETSEEEWDRLFAVNLHAPWRLSREAAAQFRASGRGRKGVILNIASTAGLNPVPGVGVYVLTKAALIMLTKQLALELAADGIHVNCICPAVVETPIFESVMSPEDAKNFLAETAPGFHALGRIGQPEDIAAAAVYLCGDAASWVTGAILPVSGG